MGLSKLGFYTSTFLIVISVFYMLSNYAVEKSTNPDYLLSEDNMQKIDRFTEYVLSSGIVVIQAENISTLKLDSLVGSDNESGAQSITDILASLSYYRSRIRKTTNYFKIFYNMPTLFTLALGIPTEAISPLINGIIIILYVWLIIIFIRLVRGS